MAHILLIEEYPALRHILTVTLQRAGYQVTLACSADAMQQLLSQQHFDLLLCDLDLRHNQSVRFDAMLRASSHSLPIVAFLTPGVYSFRSLEALGIHCALAKPIRRNTLLSAIQKALVIHQASAPQC